MGVPMDDQTRAQQKYYFASRGGSGGWGKKKKTGAKASGKADAKSNARTQYDNRTGRMGDGSPDPGPPPRDRVPEGSRADWDAVHGKKTAAHATLAQINRKWSREARAASAAARSAKASGDDWKQAGRKAFYKALPSHDRRRALGGSPLGDDSNLRNPTTGRMFETEYSLKRTKYAGKHGGSPVAFTHLRTEQYRRRAKRFKFD